MTVVENGLWGNILIVDLAAIPEGFSMEKWMELITKSGVAVYDSTMGQAPRLINITETNEHI